VRIPDQVPRLAIVFVVAVLALVAARSLLVPATFGDFGHYRAAAIDSIAHREVRFAGRQECEECHDDIGAERVSGNHRGLTCEVCHGPAESHVEDPFNVLPEPADQQRRLCPLCHQYNPSRPTGFPQIDPVAHNPLKPCVSCHDPHAPVPPQVPEECSACHGSIARQKSLSHHANLPCTTCHTVPQQHKVTPRAVRASKPAERTFCAQCHDAVKPRIEDAPQIDLQSHYPRDLCWQCHYPHFPET